jgi:hypothetical protein
MPSHDALGSDMRLDQELTLIFFGALALAVIIDVLLTKRK